MKNNPMTKKQNKLDWHQIAREETATVHADFFHPLVETTVELHEQIDGSCDTAYFDFITNKTHASQKFLDDLVTIGGLDPPTAFRGMLKHEWGHYLVYPRECAILMYLGHIAKPNFGKHKDEILAYWNDAKDNLPQMLKKHRGQDVREMYRGMNKILEEEFTFSPPERELLQGAEVNPEEIRKILREYSVDRLLTAYYQRLTEEDFGVTLEGFLAEKLEKTICNQDGEAILETVTERDEQGNEIIKQKERKEGLMTLDILNKDAELVSFLMFGTIIQEILKKREEALAPYKQKLKEKYGPLIGIRCSPHHDDAPKLEDFSDKQIEESLDEVIRKWGKERYEKIRRYVEEETSRKFDLPKPKGQGAQAGLAHSKIRFNDEQVPYYERKARTYGLYIHRKPLIVDVLNSYPEGSEKFNVGDPIRTLDPYSTYGRIMPGLTKKKKLRQGTKRDKQYKVPHLTIWLDTSGSMKHPKDGSNAVLASFVLANNYWRNEAEVGVVNFSVDLVALLPTRNLDEVYSLLCAYWGGGTVVNIPKVKEYMQRLARKGQGLGLYPEERYFTSEEDYERLVEHMHPEQRREFLDKHLEVNLDKAVKEVYEKMDTCIITDGDILNLGEVIGYVNSMAAVTRNVVFLINNPRQYAEWSKLVLPNTQIVPVDKAEDLLGLAIGEAKKIVPAEEKPASLFWR